MQAVQRKEEIRQHAQVLFRERGYAATSMRDLAETMGIEAASLYNHISSKEDILIQICFSMAEAFFAAIEPVLVHEYSHKDKLRAMIEGHLDVIAANADASAVFLHEWRHLGEPYLTNFKAMRRRYEKLFVTLIEEGVTNSEFRNINAALAARTLLSALNWTYESTKSITSNTNSLTQELCDLLLNGICKD